MLDEILSNKAPRDRRGLRFPKEVSTTKSVALMFIKLVVVDQKIKTIVATPKGKFVASS